MHVAIFLQFKLSKKQWIPKPPPQKKKQALFDFSMFLFMFFLRRATHGRLAPGLWEVHGNRHRKEWCHEAGDHDPCTKWTDRCELSCLHLPSTHPWRVEKALKRHLFWAKKNKESFDVIRYVRFFIFSPFLEIFGPSAGPSGTKSHKYFCVCRLAEVSTSGKLRLIIYR